jgi:hypothetical protein
LPFCHFVFGKRIFHLKFHIYLGKKSKIATITYDVERMLKIFYFHILNIAKFG